jgi:hypothetical protein
MDLVIPVPVSEVTDTLYPLPALFSVILALMMMFVVLRSYFNFVKTNLEQQKAVVWPLGKTPDELDGMDQFNVVLDLLSIEPESLTAIFVLELGMGGVYEHDIDAGVLELDGQSLALTLGHNHMMVASGTAFSNQPITMILDDIIPIFQYPFDMYEFDIRISADIINSTDPENVLVGDKADVAGEKC